MISITMMKNKPLAKYRDLWDIKTVGAPHTAPINPNSNVVSLLLADARAVWSANPKDDDDGRLLRPQSACARGGQPIPFRLRNQASEGREISDSRSPVGAPCRVDEVAASQLPPRTRVGTLMALPALAAKVLPEPQSRHPAISALEQLNFLLSDEDDETMQCCLQVCALRAVLDGLSKDMTPADLQQLATQIEDCVFPYGIGYRLAGLLRKASAGAAPLDAVKLYVSAAIERIHLGEGKGAIVDALHGVFGADLSDLAEAMKSK